LYYYGYNIDREANERVYPVLFDNNHKPITLKQAREEGLQLFPKRIMYLINKIRNMVIGIQNWPIESIYGGLQPLTPANNDTTSSRSNAVKIYELVRQIGNMYG
jgi:hypothetical protein